MPVKEGQLQHCLADYMATADAHEGYTALDGKDSGL